MFYKTSNVLNPISLDDIQQQLYKAARNLSAFGKGYNKTLKVRKHHGTNSLAFRKLIYFLSLDNYMDVALWLMTALSLYCGV